MVFGRESAVDAKDFLVNNGRDRKAVETVCERLPQLDVVPPLALVVEAVNAVDGCALVISAQQEKVLRVFDFVGQQQTNRLQALFSLST